ncbi:MAG: tetratricopeptide repeat protein [Methanobacteriota archaeon]|nr:MAG: tetratricopeptide repeat protein [Euryarchaeota archaeon]
MERPEEREDLFKKAVEHHNRGDYNRAIELYKKALESYGLDKKTLVLLGNAFYMEKEYEEAESAHKKALSLDPNYARAHFNLGIVYEAMGRPKEAMECYRKAIELDSGFGEAYANLGDLYKAERDLDNAIICYKKALEIDSSIENAREALKYLPRYLIEKAESRERIKRADELIREGISLEEKGDGAAAKEMYEEALKVYPESAAGFFLSRLAEGSQSLPVTREEISFLDVKTPLICDTISPEVREFLGRKIAGIDLGQRTLERFFNRFKEEVSGAEGKIDVLQVSRKILLDEPGQELSEAVEAELAGDVKEAEKRYEEVIEKAPYLLHAHYLYGMFLELNDREEEALSVYREASQHSPGYMDRGLASHIASLFARRPGYGYLKEMDVISMLREFHESTAEKEDVSLARFIRYKLAQEAEGRIRYGFEKEESGESAEAITAYEDAVSIDPTNPLIYYVLGLAYETRGLEKEAMEAYEKTRGADFSSVESSEDISRIIEEYLNKTTKDGHPVGAILGRYFEIIAEDPDQMLELLGFIEDLKIDSISRIIKSYISTDLILGADGKVVRDREDFGGSGEGEGGVAGGIKGRGRGKVVRDRLEFGEDLDKEEEKIRKAKEMSKISFELLWKYKTQRSIRCEATTGDARMILAGSENGIVYLIDQKASSPWRHESGSAIVDIALSPEGRYGVFCNAKGLVALLDCKEDGRVLWEKDMSRGGAGSVAISSEGRSIAVSTNNFEIMLFDRDGRKKGSYTTDQLIKTLDVTEDGKTLLAASMNGLYLARDGGQPRRLEAYQPPADIQSAAISRDGGFIAVGTRGGDVALLNRDGEVLWTKGTPTPVYAVSVSSEGKVVSGSLNGAIMLFSREGEELWRYQTGENIWDVDISEKGDMIVSGCGLVFGNIYLFRLK